MYLARVIFIRMYCQDDGEWNEYEVVGSAQGEVRVAVGEKCLKCYDFWFANFRFVVSFEDLCERRKDDETFSKCVDVAWLSHNKAVEAEKHLKYVTKALAQSVTSNGVDAFREYIFLTESELKQEAGVKTFRKKELENVPIVMLPEKGSEDDTLVEHYAFLDPDRPHKYGRVWLSVRNDLKTPLVQSSLFEGHASMVHAASSLDRMESKGEQALVRSKAICTLEEWLQDKMGVEPNASERTSTTRDSDLCRVAIRDGGDRAGLEGRPGRGGVGADQQVGGP